jgi:uncharacterized protein (DUF433 family)
MIEQKSLTLMMDYDKFIQTIPGKRGGSPCIKGTRITVSDVLNWLSHGMTEKDILRDYPELSKKHIKACLDFDADQKNQ